MPPVALFIGEVVGALIFTVTGGAVAITTGVAMAIGSAIILAVSVVASSLLSAAPKPSRMKQGNELDIKLDPTMPRQILVGTTATGGSAAWAFTYTDDDNYPNRYLVRIIAISDYPCTALVAVTEGSNIYGAAPNVLSFAGDITTGWYACNQHTDGAGATRMYMRLYLGVTPVQAKQTLTVASLPTNGSTLTINGVTITWTTGTPTSAQVAIGATTQACAANLRDYINAKAPTVLKCSANLPSGSSTITLAAKAAGAAGNAVTLASSSGAVTLGGATLTGGSGDAVADATTTGMNSQWDASHKGTGMCYAIAKYDYNVKAFPNGEPQLVFVMQGAKAYDQRLDSTRTSPTRTGTQRLADQNSWAFSDNAAVITQQVLRGYYVNGTLIFGAQATDTDLPDAMLLAAYNTCDLQVSKPSGGTEAQYKANMILTTSDQVSQDLADLQAAMDGNIYDRSGVIAILPGGSRTPIFDLTDNDVVWEEESSWQPMATLDTLFNSVTGSYLPSSQQFIETPFTILRNSSWEFQDGGVTIPRNIAYRAVTSDTQVQRINLRVWKGSRYQGTLGFVMNMTGLQIEQGDWFRFSSIKWGFSFKYFIVTQITLLSNLRIGVVATEISPDIDGWVPADEYRTPTFTTRAPTTPTIYDQVPPSNTINTHSGIMLITDLNFSDPWYWYYT